jgi:hypothetical protein
MLKKRRERPREYDMKKYRWLIAGIAALVIASAVILNVSAQSNNAMSEDCVEDGSCCSDEDVCSC